jgi:hypothetical protein
VRGSELSAKVGLTSTTSLLYEVANLQTGAELNYLLVFIGVYGLADPK